MVILVALLGLLLVVATLAGVWFRSRVQASLPQLQGEQRVSGLAAPVAVARDALGIPEIAGASRKDVAFATGFVHAQDRLFQMDVLRRLSAGELAALLGPVAVRNDKTMRVHRFRAEAEKLLASSPAEVKDLLAAYAAGVNAGRSGLGEKPFEYLAMRTEPAPWRPEDSFLVLLSMFSRLQDPDGSHESAVSLMSDSMPAELFRFLTPGGTEWDTPLVGGPLPLPPLPGPEVCDMRKTAKTARFFAPSDQEESVPGSSAWAVAGSLSADGGALLANELHLDLAVPNYFYRVSLSWPEAKGRRRVTGVTLPGSPAVVLGSNGQVAWGITNSAIDTSDLVLLDVDPARPDFYSTPDGPRRFERHRETIRVNGGEDQVLDADWTIWGPVVDKDPAGRLRVLRWVAHDPEAVDFRILGLETAQTVEQALEIAHHGGIPAVNFVTADSGGHIAWSLMGRIPRRAPGFDGQVAGSWKETAQRWPGLLPPEEIPQIVDPPSGRLWNGNNRSVDGEMLAKLGGGPFVLGARARQIRDDLFALDRATAEDMRKIQMDDRALFLTRWHDFLLRVLTPEAVAADPRRRELRQFLQSWNGRATVDSVGYRMVRSYRMILGGEVFNHILAGCSRMPASFDDYFLRYAEAEAEGPLWKIVTEQPPHLLPPPFKTWQEQFLAAVDKLFSLLPPGPLPGHTWGERNVAEIQHPFSHAVPFVGRWLDMPRQPLPGDIDIPRVQMPSWGPALRMVVSPGREEAGFFQMPGGQSGNPLSPHYRDGHAAWVEGKPTPFLPGPPVSMLRLLP